MPDDTCLPLPFIEALGRATVARYRLQLAIDTLIVILAAECEDRDGRHPLDSFEAKVDFLQRMPSPDILEYGCRQRLQAIASLSKKLNADYENGAMSSVYSRGAGSLEETLRALAEKANISAVPLRMTALKIDRLTRSFKALTWRASDLARDLLQMLERPADRQGAPLPGEIRTEI